MFKEERRHAIINLLIRIIVLASVNFQTFIRLARRLFVPIYAISRNQVCFSVAMAEGF